jgi:sugar phosphate isomerase/epimerase
MRIGLAGWALVQRFKAEADPLRMVDFFGVVREEFGIEVVEINNVFLESYESGYLATVKQAAADAGVEMEGMAVDQTGDLSVLDEETRKQHIASAMSHFGVAEQLGLRYFRVNTGGKADGPPEMLEACIDSFRQLAEEGQKRGIAIATENHGGLSTDPDMMVKLVEGVGLPTMKTLPDTGNFPEDILLDGIRKLMPWAANVHFKWTRRDAEGKRDVPALVKVVKEAGFDGTLMIEDRGLGADHLGILELKGALMACLNSALV